MRRSEAALLTLSQTGSPELGQDRRQYLARQPNGHWLWQQSQEDIRVQATDCKQPRGVVEDELLALARAAAIASAGDDT